MNTMVPGAFLSTRDAYSESVECTRLLLTLDLSGKGPELLAQLRRYVADESWAHYRTAERLFHKEWLSSARPYEFAAFHLWESTQARESEVKRMHRMREITLVDATIRIAMWKRLRKARIRNGN